MMNLEQNIYYQPAQGPGNTTREWTERLQGLGNGDECHARQSSGLARPRVLTNLQ